MPLPLGRFFSSFLLSLPRLLPALTSAVRGARGIPVAVRENATQYAIHHDKQLDKQNEAAETILMNEVTGRPGMSCVSVRSPAQPGPQPQGEHATAAGKDEWRRSLVLVEWGWWSGNGYGQALHSVGKTGHRGAGESV